LDLPQIVLPAALYNSILCSLIVMASWHASVLADGLRKRYIAQRTNKRG
jgi:hypothetical protein